MPPFDVAYLEKGHAVHFRCRHPACDGLRVDVMSVMRGVDPFELIWQRRATIELPDGTVCDLLSIADLVRAKKTQRDKDWPMIRRLLEADFFGEGGGASQTHGVPQKLLKIPATLFNRVASYSSFPQ